MPIVKEVLTETENKIYQKVLGFIETYKTTNTESPSFDDDTSHCASSTRASTHSNWVCLGAAGHSARMERVKSHQDMLQCWYYVGWRA